MAPNKLTWKNGTLLGLGSLIGSGIVFLPGKIFAAAPNVTILVWVLGAFICSLFIPLFNLLVEGADLSKGIRGFLDAGPLAKTQYSITALVLGTVSFGMPISALLIARVVTESFLLSPNSSGVLAIGFLAVGFFTLRGYKSSEKLVTITAFLFIFLAILIFSLTFKVSTPTYQNVAKWPEGIKEVTNGSVLVFWAFAGFENILFLSDKFENPKKDIPRSMFFSLLLAGIVYFLVQLNYSALAIHAMNLGTPVRTGLLFLADNQNIFSTLPSFVGLFSAAALLLNFTAWYAGIASLISHGISSREIPLLKSQRKGFIGLITIQIAICIYCSFNQSAVDTLLRQVSVNFIVIYWAMSIRFVQIAAKNPSVRSITGLLLFALITFILLDQAQYLIYPMILLFAVTRLRTHLKKSIVTASLIIFSLTASPSEASEDVLVFVNFRQGMNQTADLAREGFELAKEEKNAPGNVKFRLIDIDDNIKTAADQALSAIERYHPILMIGAIRSDHALVISDLAERKHIPFITPLATYPDLTKKKEFTFRTCFDDNQQAKHLADFILKNKKRNRALIITNTESTFSIGFSKAFSDAFEREHGKILSKIVITQQDDLRIKLDSLSKYNPDVIVLPSYQVEAAAMIALLAPKFTKAIFVGPDSWGGGDLFRKVFTRGKKFEGYYSEHWSNASKTAETKKFLSAIKKTRADIKLIKNTSDNSMLATAVAFYELTNFAKKILRGKKTLSIIERIKSTKFLGPRGLIDFSHANTPEKPIYIYAIGPDYEKFEGRYPR